MSFFCSSPVTSCCKWIWIKANTSVLIPAWIFILIYYQNMHQYITYLLYVLIYLIVSISSKQLCFCGFPGTQQWTTHPGYSKSGPRWVLPLLDWRVQSGKMHTQKYTHTHQVLDAKVQTADCHLSPKVEELKC